MSTIGYLDNVVTQVGVVDNCADLNTLLAKVTQDVNELSAKIAAQIEKLAPLMVAPTDLPSVISWAEAMIQSYVLPHANLLAQQTALTAKLADVTSAAAARASQLGCP